METLDEEIGFKYAQFVYSIKTVSCEGLAKKKRKKKLRQHIQLKTIEKHKGN